MEHADPIDAQRADVVAFSAAGATNRGRRRVDNEDAFFLSSEAISVTSGDLGELPATLSGEWTLFAGVFDGMGGHAAGEVASGVAVEAVLSALRDHGHPDAQCGARSLSRALAVANAAVRRAASAPGRHGMGTTATVAAAHGGDLLVGQVGDSRAYLLSMGALIRLTRDQSVVGSLVQSGQISEAEGRGHPLRNIVLQVLGGDRKLFPEVTHVRLRRGDRLLLCSDGLHNSVDESAILTALDADASPLTTCQALVELALLAGGKDNVTVVVADFDGPGLPAASLPERKVATFLKFDAKC